MRINIGTCFSISTLYDIIPKTRNLWELIENSFEFTAVILCRNINWKFLIRVVLEIAYSLLKQSYINSSSIGNPSSFDHFSVSAEGPSNIWLCRNQPYYLYLYNFPALIAYLRTQRAH